MIPACSLSYRNTCVVPVLQLHALLKNLNGFLIPGGAANLRPGGWGCWELGIVKQRTYCN